MSLSSGYLAACPLSIEQVHWCMDCCYKEIQSRFDTLSGSSETALETADSTFNPQRTINALLQRMVPIRFNDNVSTPSTSKSGSLTSSATSSRSSSSASTSSRAFKTKALGASASLKRKVFNPSAKVFSRDSQKVPWEVHLRSLSTEQMSEVLAEILSMAPVDWIPQHLFDFIVRPQGRTLKDIMEMLPSISQEVLKCLLSSVDTLADIASREQQQSIAKNEINNSVSPRTHARQTLIKRFASLVFRIDDSLAAYTPISSLHPEIEGTMPPPGTYQGLDVGMFMDHYPTPQSVQDKASVFNFLIQGAFENLIQGYREDRQLTSDVLFPYEETPVDWSLCELHLVEPPNDPDPPCPSLPLPPWRMKLPRSILKKPSKTQMMAIEPPENPPCVLQLTSALREESRAFQVPTPPPSESPDDNETEKSAQDTESAPSVEANPYRHSTSRPLVPRNSLWESSPPLHALPHPLPKWATLRPGYTYKTSYWQFKYRQRAKRCYGSMDLGDTSTYQALVRRASEPEWSHPKGRRNCQNVSSIMKPTPRGSVGRSDSCGPAITTPPKLLKRPSRKYPPFIGEVIPPTPKIPKQVAQDGTPTSDTTSESLAQPEKCHRPVRDQPTIVLLQKKSNDSLQVPVAGTRTVRIITTQIQSFNTATMLVKASEASNHNSDIINNNRKMLDRRSKSFDQLHPCNITPRSTSRGTATVPLAMPPPVELVDDLFQPSQGDYPATLIPPMFLYTPSKIPHPEAILATTSVSPPTSPSMQPKKSFHQMLFGKKNTKIVDHPAVEEKYVGTHRKNKKHMWDTSPKNTHA
ncbi:hypothetical protein BGZ82_009374 [Podila clonocystis]|nr:hypothetical protein BGZ82_009374 [Podila clonocystis]